MTVPIEILHVVDCPNAEIAHRRALDVTQATTAVVTTTEVADDAAAAHRGMRGSPTIFINGHDPFNDLANPTSCSCRVRPGTDPVPTVAEIKAAIAS
jgi:hypothetical protein